MTGYGRKVSILSGRTKARSNCAVCPWLATLRKMVLPIFIRSSALQHLRDVVDSAATPDAQILFEEFITKQDFHAWLTQAGLHPPSFWFEAGELQAG